MRREDIVEPVRGVHRHWAILLHPDTRRARSKVWAKNETIDVNNRIFPWITAFLPILVGKPEESAELVFPFSYQEFLKEWRAVLKPMPLHAVPYQARHSGASLDAALLHRPRKEIMDRGRWASQGSLVRYEKHARVAASLTRLPAEWRAFYETTDAQLEALFADRVVAAAAAPPAIRAPK